jgi:sortase A
MKKGLTRLFSYTLTACGLLLLFAGGRELVESRLGQSEVAHDFATSTAATVRPPEATSAPTPASGEALAKLRIPRLDSELYVIEGDGEKELRRGPGHITGTAMPGAAGNCVIAGHRDTHFRVLKDIRKGDDIVLETPQGQFLYRVRRTTVVSPDDTASLQPTTDHRLNLITCFPFYYVGSAPKRFVVEARLAGSIARVPPRGSPSLPLAIGTLGQGIVR